MPASGTGRQARFDHLRSLLAIHETAEEAHVHPVAKKVGGESKRLILARLAEEKSAKHLLTDLQGSRAQGPAFTAST